MPCLQAEAVLITALLAGTTTDRNTMIEYLRTTGKRFLSLKKDKNPAERLSPHVGQCTSPHCHRYQGVPDPEGRGTGETVTLLTQPEPV
ncbi:Uncharacterized protein FKW44_008982 [Caligus rogercresseyi]|uniref:Uncharacterized protein n=1 Tax=Caligus rogercresseyi TaxID=217165 RepID=A0A7T8K6B3_CALRO|nr:Uncharacterized protein FKW44_008982 [Caligus rogercresseyi]